MSTLPLYTTNPEPYAINTFFESAKNAFLIFYKSTKPEGVIPFYIISTRYNNKLNTDEDDVKSDELV